MFFHVSLLKELSKAKAKRFIKLFTYEWRILL